MSHLSRWGLVSIALSAVKADISGIVKGFLGVPDAGQPSCPGSAAHAGIKVTSSSGSLVKWCAGPAADPVAGGAVVRIVNNHGFAIQAGYPVSWTVTRFGREEDWQTRLLDDAALGLSPQPASRSAIVIPGGGEIELHIPAGQAGTVSTMVSGPAILASAFMLGIQVLAFTYDRLPWFPKSSPSRLDQVVSSLSGVHDCTESAGKLKGDDPGTPAGIGDIFRGDLEYVFGCLKDAWKQAYGLSGVIATAAVSVALVVADAAVALVESVLAGVDAVRYFSGYQITVTSPGPPCAPREFLPEDGNGQKWTMLNYACLDGYALALAKTTFTTGDSPPEDGVATFRAIGNEWVIYGGWDDGACLLGTPAVCGGLARAPGTEPPHDILLQLVHAAGLSVTANGANIQSPAG